MSADSGSTSGYIGAFQDFVQANAPAEDSMAGRRLQQQQPEPGPSNSEQSGTTQDATVSTDSKQSSSAKPKKRQKLSSDDDDDETETESDLAKDDDPSSPESESSEPPAVPRRLRTQRSAKQKLMSKMSSRGRGRGLSVLSLL